MEGGHGISKRSVESEIAAYCLLSLVLVTPYASTPDALQSEACLEWREEQVREVAQANSALVRDRDKIAIAVGSRAWAGERSGLEAL